MRHRESGWLIAPDGASGDAEGAVCFDSEDDAREFVERYTCEPFGFEVVPAAEAQAAA